MIGCFAQASDTDIVVDTAELEDARWFSRQEVAAMLAGTHADGLSTPKPFAIAHHAAGVRREGWVGIARLSVPQKERLQLHGIAWCARPEAGSLTPA